MNSCGLSYIQSFTPNRIVSRLAATRPADDYSARLGGDEILMAFQKMPIKVTLKKAEMIRKKLGKIVISREKQRISITVSIGIAAYPIHGSSISELISRADEALYIAKENGKNQVAIAPEVRCEQEA